MDENSRKNQLWEISSEFSKELKNFVKNIDAITDYQINEDEDDVVNQVNYEKDENKSLYNLRYMKIPICAPLCFSELVQLNPSNGIMLIGHYLRFSRILEKDNRLYPLIEFFKREDIFALFEDNISEFLKIALPIIFKYNQCEELEILGIYVDIDQSTEVDDFLINIMIVKNESTRIFDNEYLQAHIDQDTKNLLQETHDKMTPIDEEVALFSSNLSALSLQISTEEPSVIPLQEVA